MYMYSLLMRANKQVILVGWSVGGQSDAVYNNYIKFTFKFKAITSSCMTVVSCTDDLHTFCALIYMVHVHIIMVRACRICS